MTDAYVFSLVHHTLRLINGIFIVCQRSLHSFLTCQITSSVSIRSQQDKITQCFVHWCLKLTFNVHEVSWALNLIKYVYSWLSALSFIVLTLHDSLATLPYIRAHSNRVLPHCEYRIFNHYWQDIKCGGLLYVQLSKWENILFCPTPCNSLCSNKTSNNAVPLSWQLSSAFVM